jgi:hypothetical protein
MSSDRKTNVTHALSQAEWDMDWAIEFIKAKKIEGLSPNTIHIYEQQRKPGLQRTERLQKGRTTEGP